MLFRSYAESNEANKKKAEEIEKNPVKARVFDKFERAVSSAHFGGLGFVATGWPVASRELSHDWRSAWPGLRGRIGWVR